MGLLIAPKPGKETREEVGNRTNELKHRAGDYASILQEKFRRNRDASEAEEAADNHVVSSN